MAEVAVEVVEEAEVVEAKADEIIMVAEEAVAGVEEEVEEDEEGVHPPTMQLYKKFKIVSPVKARTSVASLSFPRGKGNQIP